MAVLTHLLAVLFGMGSWVSINGLWVELPLIVPQVPEGWYLPSYLSVLIQAANVGPLVVTLMHRLRPGVLNEVAAIYVILAVGAVASFLLAFFWKETVAVAGAPRSLALLVLTFFLAAVDCTSSVTFLPFMTRLQPNFLTSYFIGEGLSGLLPALAALVQGVGLVRCVTSSQSLNHSGHGTGPLEAQYQPSNFSAEVFFFFLSAMMLASLAAFLLLDRHPAVARQQPEPRSFGGSRETSRSSRKRAEQRPMMDPCRPPNHKPRSSLGSSSCSQKQLIFIFVVLGWVNALSNTVLPSVQSYSCLPYGNIAYHLSATLAAVSNPLAGFVAVFVSIRSVAGIPGFPDGSRNRDRVVHNADGGAESVPPAGQRRYRRRHHGARMDPLHLLSVLCEDHHGDDPAGRRSQRPGVVWSGGAARLPAGSRRHVSSGQRLRPVLLRGPVQHQLPLRVREGPQ